VKEVFERAMQEVFANIDDIAEVRSQPKRYHQSAIRKLQRPHNRRAPADL